MNYNIMITGDLGFIGWSVYKRFKAKGREVNQLDFRRSYNDLIDIRSYWNEDPASSIRRPYKSIDYVFHFASPSSQVLFKSVPEYETESAIGGLLIALGWSNKLIFPSTSSMYGVLNSYAHVKLASEHILQASNKPFLAPRIFAGYGPGEDHKGDYASVIFQWLKAIRDGKNISIWGDGSQSRDFIFIEDIADWFMENYQELEGIHDVGTGISTSFIEVVRIIRKVTGKDFIVEYVEKPMNYLETTKCERPLKKFTMLEDGIKQTWEYLLKQ